MSRFTEITSSVSKSYLKNGGWNAFGSSFSDTSFDGIKLQTGSLNFYLRYRTCNKTYGWYPYVTSKVNDYAGSSGKAVEAVQIQLYNNSGTKIDRGFIVMYRAYANNDWLGWVSNASPERMQMIYNQFGFDGALDLTGANSGLPGNGIALSQFEIRIFEEDLSVDPGDIPTSEVNGVSQSYMVNGVWNALTSSVSSAMHGVRIQTTGKPYYLKYRTYNTGHGWYPYVLSNDTSSEAYAGSSGKAIEGIQIQVYDNAGAKLSKTFVVMYRVFADGNWLDWVSNAPYDIMQSLQAEANLGGNLDGTSSNAGYPGTGKAITQVDIRVFEYVKEPSNNYPAATGEFSQIYHSGGTWYELTANTHVSSMDGVKLTTSNSNYSIKYRTYSTETGWLPYVTSTSTDYAGSFGKAIEALQIEVYDSSNVKLDNTYVVMYRAYANGAWLDWVSNANPEKMNELLERDKLDGDLDTAGAYAGIKGTALNKLQIRFYPKEPVVLPSETTIEKPVMSYMVGSSTSWTAFEDTVTVSKMDGIKIRTSADKSYYLQYRTFNEGKTAWYPYVKSTVEDYAGSAGKAIQRFQIQAYKNDGTKLSSGVIVMYRAYVNGAWLNWVSNADKANMEFVQDKYKLGGSLDTAGSYAGISGKNIAGIEIHVYVDNAIATEPTTPTGAYKIISAPFLSQLGSYPTGCESVSAVMALNYAGVNITVDNFIDSYLEMSNMPFDPYLTFGGNPRSTTGYGCYAPVIKKAMNKALSETNYTAQVVNNLSLNELCTRYIDNNIPVVLWATMSMKPPKVGSWWVYDSRRIEWIVPEHCLLLVGYDDNNYIFNDPMRTSAQTYYSKASVEAAYLGLHCQAVVVGVKKEEPETPTYKYGAVKNPVTGEIYPIQFCENGKQYLEPAFELELNPDEKKPTNLDKNTFSLAQFISGIEIDNSLIEARKCPVVGNLVAIVAAGITSWAESWDSIYIDVYYYKEPVTGQKKATARCGDSYYCGLFKNFPYGNKPISMKTLHSMWYGASAWEEAVYAKAIDDMAREQYGIFKGITPNDDYHYDLEYTLDERRKNDKYVSYIFFGEDGNMYEYATIYDNEKIEIVVTKGGLMGTFEEEVDRINILPLIRPISKLPDDKAALFNIMRP